MSCCRGADRVLTYQNVKDNFATINRCTICAFAIIPTGFTSIEMHECVVNRAKRGHFRSLHTQSGQGIAAKTKKNCLAQLSDPGRGLARAVSSSAAALPMRASVGSDVM